LDSLTENHCVGCSCRYTLLHDFCFKRFVSICAGDFEILVFSAECVRVFWGVFSNLAVNWCSLSSLGDSISFYRSVLPVLICTILCIIYILQNLH